MARRAPNILITGTPGTGKSTLCENVASTTGLRHLEIGKLVKSQQLHSGWDDEFDCLVIDEEKVRGAASHACRRRRRPLLLPPPAAAHRVRQAARVAWCAGRSQQVVTTAIPAAG